MPSAPEGNWREKEERAISIGEARMDEEREYITAEEFESLAGEWSGDSICDLCGRHGDTWGFGRIGGLIIEYLRCPYCDNTWRLVQ